MLKVNSRLLAIILDEKGDFLNDAKEVFPADVNQEQLQSLPAPALKSLSY